MTIPNSVTSIGDFAFGETPFYNNQEDGLVYVGKVAYQYKGTMPENTEIVIKDGTVSIGESVFFSCKGLSSVTIPNSVTSIGKRAFQGCIGLTSVTIPNSVKSIGNSAFYGCSGLTSVTIPNSVTIIGDNAFARCTNLTSVTIPGSVTTVGLNPFFSTPFYNNQEDGLVYVGKVVCVYKGTMPENTKIVIKDGTVSIGTQAFRNCRGMTSVTIPNSVTSIGNNAFNGCSGLTSVVIPNSVTSIGNSAFYGCSGLTSVTIPNSVTSIEQGTFAYCSGLTSMIIPNSVTSIGYEAFLGCGNLTSVTIPSSVISMGPSALDCGLTSINITDIAAWCKPSVSNFDKSSQPYGGYPNSDCHLLLNGEEIKDLDIPESVTEIGAKAFSICPNITSVKVHWNRPLAGGADSFQPEVRKKATLYVPKGTAMMYMAASGWAEFANIMEFENGEDAHYITIRMGEGGVLKQSVEVGKVYTYTVSADKGWSVNTITFDGKDMTSMLMDGQYSTPVITGNSELNVVFKQGDLTDTRSVAAASDVKVYAHANTVTITGADNNAPVAVYNMSGIKVKSAVGNATLSLDHGAYIIKVGKDSFKVNM